MIFFSFLKYVELDQMMIIININNLLIIKNLKIFNYFLY